MSTPKRIWALIKKIGFFLRSNLIFVLVFFSVAIMFVLNFVWWFCAPLNKFSLWYPHVGIIIWLIKTLFILIMGIGVFVIVGLFMHWFIQTTKSFFQKFFYLLKKLVFFSFIFTTYMLFSIYLGEEHPFSCYPMYERILSSAKYFYFTDQEGVHVPNMVLTKTPSQFIDKLYKVHMDSQGYSLEDIVNDKKKLFTLGEFIMNNTILDEARLKKEYQSVTLYIVDCGIEKYSCDTILLGSRNFGQED